MPNPSNFKDEQSFISKCIEENIKEGKTKDEAAGKCYGIWRQHTKKSIVKGLISNLCKWYKVRSTKKCLTSKENEALIPQSLAGKKKKENKHA